MFCNNCRACEQLTLEIQRESTTLNRACSGNEIGSRVENRLINFLFVVNKLNMFYKKSVFWKSIALRSYLIYNLARKLGDFAVSAAIEIRRHALTDIPVPL